MKANHRDECQVKVREQWTVIDIDDALGRDADKLKRCPECHGRVRAHKDGSTGSRKHFEHLRAHTGCSLKPRFSGTRSRHPDALE